MTPCVDSSGARRLPPVPWSAGLGRGTLNGHAGGDRSCLHPGLHCFHGFALHSGESMGREGLAGISTPRSFTTDREKRPAAFSGELLRIPVRCVGAGIVFVMYPEQLGRQLLQLHAGKAWPVSRRLEHRCGQNRPSRQLRIHARRMICADRTFAQPSRATVPRATAPDIDTRARRVNRSIPWVPDSSLPRVCRCPRRR